MATTTVDYAGQVLTDVRRQIAVDDDVLSETKARRNLVKKHARSFPGALKTFDSGSVAHGNVNKPVSDADCGVVLDRRKYQELGPDGDDVPPNNIGAEMAEHVIDGVREEYPDAIYTICKRAIKLPDGVSRATAVARLRELGEAVSCAVDAETLEDAEAALSEVFPDYVESGSAVRSLGDALRRQKRAQLGTAFGIGAADLKPARAYGDETR